MAILDSQLEGVLRRIVTRIEPTPNQKIRAGLSHNHLRDVLSTGNFESRIISSYLSGSYSRGTALRPLNDVDIIFEIDPSGWDLPTIFSSKPSPDKVLRSFERCIRYRYPSSSLRMQRRSVCLQLHHLDIDVVPGIPIASAPGVILIPDRERDDWIKTAPRLHSEIATRVNETRAKRFKPLVKLLKLWNENLPSNTESKSFMIETVATRIFQSTNFDSLSEGLLLFWDFLSSRYGDASIRKWPDGFGMSFDWMGTNIPDAVGLKNNTAQSVDAAQAERLCERARISRDHMIAARKARTVEAMENSAGRALRIS